MVFKRNITDMVGSCLLLILGTMLTAQGFHCPDKDGKYPHAVECNAFYKCDKGQHHLFNCPPGFYYNTAIDDCDRPENVLDCVQGHRFDSYRAKLKERQENPKASKYQNWFHCPDDGNFAHPTDCRYYYWCINGLAEKQACPPGTVFSTRDNLCNWPALVPECSRDGTRNGGDVYVASGLGKYGSLRSKRETESVKVSTYQSSSDLFSFQCNNETGNYPHPASCTIYFWCVGFRHLIQRCPPNTLFSAEEGICTWPHLASGCDIFTGERIGGQGLRSKADTYQGWRNHFECPEESGYFRHEEDCNVFYWCTNWEHTLSNCAPGSFFSPDLKACTWPREVPDCDEHDGHRLDIYRNKGVSKRNRRSAEEVPKAVTFQSVDARSVCPEDYGYFPHPTDCKRYYWCLGPIAYEQTCSGDLLFDPVIVRCSWKHTVRGCDSEGRRISPYKGIIKLRNKRSPKKSPLNQGGYGPDEFQCPGMDGTYRHHSNCSIYYVCKNGHPTKFSCNLGSVLNPVRNNCDWPKNVPDCDPRGVRIGSLPTPSKEEQKKRSPRSAYRHTDADHHRQPNYGNFRCPYHDGFYGHPIDCRVYYWCINGMPTKMLCAGGTFFNPTLGNCGPMRMRPDCDLYTGMKINFSDDKHSLQKRQVDQRHSHEEHHFQENRNGDHHSAGNDDPHFGGNHDHHFGGNDDHHFGRNGGDIYGGNGGDIYGGNDGFTSSFECPETDGHYTDPEDCTAYYWCVQGKPIHQKCTGGTVYNPILFSCDHAWKVPGCNGGPSVYTAVNSEKRIKRQTDDHTHEDHPQSPSAVDFECPGPDGYYPHPTDCESYFWCVNGKANLQKCSGGSVFNPDLHSCDHPWKVPGCESPSQSRDPENTSDMLIARKKRQTHDDDEYLTCPPMDGTYRHPKDCSIYYKCANGYPTVYSCSGGSVYNPETFNCGWPSQVSDCDENGRRIRNAAMRSVKVFRSARKIRSSHNIEESEFRCPSSYGYFRHPTECKKYFWCVKNRPTLMTCLGDNYFDIAIRRCHWPWKLLDCDSNGMRIHRHKRSPDEPQTDLVDTSEGKADSTYFRCPDQDGYYRHAVDCKRYYWCVGHQVTEVECAKGTVYNPDIRGCDMPFNVPDCDAEGLRRTQYQTDWDFQFRCPKGKNSDGYYRHPSDCTMYYRCNYGKRTSYRCTPGTYFDPVNSVCTWPGEVIDCDRNGKIIVDTYNDQPTKAKGEDGNRDKKINSTEATESSTTKNQSTEKTSEAVTSGTSTNDQTTPKSTWWTVVKENSQTTKFSSTGKVTATVTKTPVTVTKTPVTVTRKPITVATKKPLVTVSNKFVTKKPAVTETVKPVVTKTSQSPVTKNRKTYVTVTVKPAVTKPSEPRVTENRRTYVTVTAKPTVTENKRPYVTVTMKPSTTETTVKTSPSITTRKYRKITPRPTDRQTDKETSGKPKYWPVSTQPTGKPNPKSRVNTNETDSSENKAEKTQTVQNEPDRLSNTKAKLVNTKPYLGISAYNFGFKCPYDEGYFRDMTDCGAYFHCKGGIPYRRDCQKDHYYSPASSTCIPAYLVTDCHKQVEPTPFFYPDEKESGEFVCPELYGYFPDPDDCASYFECIDGNHYNHRCMLGTYFDPKKRKCSWENLAINCPSNKLVTSDDLSNGFFCPAPSGLFRDPTTCTLYFECINGVPHSKACEAGTFFDASKKKCTWAKMVKDCDEFGRPKPIKQSVFKNQEAVNPNSFICPLPNGHFRDVRDCSRFYHCVKNVAYSGRCKDENAFDVYSLRCVPRSEVEGCDIMPTVPLIAMTTSAPLDFKCPKTYGYFRDYYNCSVYYYCVGGVYFRHTCKPGTVFHKDKSTCTWPHLVPDCLANGTIINQRNAGSSPDRRQSDYDTELLGQSQNAAGPTLEELEAFSDFRCPPLFDGFYGDYLSCSKFYRCVAGKRYDFVCPNGTFFDKARRVCNFLEDVTDCSPDGFRITSAGENQNEIAVEVKTLLFPKTEIDISEPRCPESDGLFPDPTSCDKFIYCSRFVPLVLPCPDKLLFNMQKKTCDYSENVVCVRYD